MTKNIFILGLDEQNRHHLRSLRGAEGYNFHNLLTAAEVLERDYYPLDEYLAKANYELDSYPGSVDAVCGYWDFPVSNLVPMLCQPRGLPSASLEAVIKCEHKYWSRIEQRKVAPEAVPPFARFDPYDDDALDKLGLDFPFWIKPIKSFSSVLGFRINTPREFHRAQDIIRANIGRLATPFFNNVLRRIETPDEIHDTGHSLCIAEKLIGGRQCTLEGYVHDGEVTVYGAVDSIRLPNRTSFARYQYPSHLPRHVLSRMTDIAARVLLQVGYDRAPFNAELYWDERRDKIWILEINTRISQSHCDLFKKVDGVSHHQVMVDCALGKRPDFPTREGDFRVAGKLFYRRHGDAYVRRVPSEENLARIAEELPGTAISILPRPGMYLSDLKDQDSYTYILAILFLGGRSQEDLLAKYRQAIAMLDFELEDVSADEARRRAAPAATPQPVPTPQPVELSSPAEAAETPPGPAPQPPVPGKPAPQSSLEEAPGPTATR